MYVSQFLVFLSTASGCLADRTKGVHHISTLRSSACSQSAPFQIAKPPLNICAELLPNAVTRFILCRPSHNGRNSDIQVH